MTTPCSLALLESALAGNLPSEDETALHRHLEECQPCGAALERMAGGPAWCQEAAALLAEDDLDAALPGHSIAGRGEWSEVDFTVEHLEPADEPGVLGRLGGYDVLEIIGRGGMGVVLKAFDPELKRCVAIKVLSPHLAASSLARKRFEREARAIAAVVHPHVLAIHQVQAAGRLPFLVMPLVAGESLAQRLTAQGRLELKEILRIGMQAAAGLSAAHEQGLVHRDVKPANILLEKGVERAVLTDFGLARAADDVSMTRWGIIAGTPQYMSPEQARGEALDRRSDLFSLGCVLYEMATGVSPFRTDSTLATLRRLVDDAPQSMLALNPELPPWFVGIVERLLEKDPSKRFASAKEVSELLEGCLAHLQQPGSVPLPANLISPRPLGEGQGVRAKCSPLLPGEGHGVRAEPRSFQSRKHLTKGTLLMLSLLGISLFAVGVATTNPPDISGQWQGPDWGQVVLKQTAPGQYAGSYTDTVGKGPGRIELKWSRIERRFNGTWREGDDDRFGDLSVRFLDKEIHGALTTDAKSKINPATPRLADLTWTRAGPTAAAAAAIPSPSEGKKATDAQSPKSLTFGSAAMMVIQKYSTSDKVLSGSLTVHDDMWVADVKSPQTLQLFERTQPCSEDCTVFYRAKLRTERFQGQVYLEMWCRLPGRGEFFSRGMNNTLGGSTDWVSCETPFFLKKGERPDLIRLNVVAQGTGVVEVKDVELLRTWNEKASGTTLPAPPAANDPHPHAVQFDGNHYAKVEPPPKFTSGDFTISLWFNPVRSDNWAYLFMRGFAYRDQPGDIGLFLNVHSGDLSFDARTAINDWLFGWAAPETRLHCPVRYGQWNHAVVTHCGDAYSMWMNGKCVCSEPTHSDTFSSNNTKPEGEQGKSGGEGASTDISDTDNTNPFIVGGFTHDDGVIEMFHGALDDFRIFRRCLPDKEIAALYTSNGGEAFLHGDGRVKFGPLIVGRTVKEPNSERITTHEKTAGIASQRIATLEALVRRVEKDFEAGNAPLSELFEAQDALLNAQLQAAKSKTERVAVWEKLLRSRQDFEKKAASFTGERAETYLLRARAERAEDRNRFG